MEPPRIKRYGLIIHGSRFCLVERQILIGKRLYGLKILREEKGISLYPALDDLRSLFAGDVERLFGLVILQNRKLTVSQRRELLLSRRVGVNNGLSGPGQRIAHQRMGRRHGRRISGLNPGCKRKTQRQKQQQKTTGYSLFHILSLPLFQ